MKPFEEGNNVFIRTITSYYTGKVVHVTEREIILREAAWIADSGRFSVAMAKGTFNEVEPYPDDMEVFVSRDAIVDAVSWPHTLPRDVQ